MFSPCALAVWGRTGLDTTRIYTALCTQGGGAINSHQAPPPAPHVTLRCSMVCYGCVFFCAPSVLQALTTAQKSEATNRVGNPILIFLFRPHPPWTPPGGGPVGGLGLNSSLPHCSTIPTGGQLGTALHSVPRAPRGMADPPEWAENWGFRPIGGPSVLRTEGFFAPSSACKTEGTGNPPLTGRFCPGKPPQGGFFP